MSRALAWGIMQRHVKINQVTDKDDHLTCFIEDPNEFMDEIPRESNGLGLNGGYEVWDQHLGEWVRSGKSKGDVKRLREHDKAKDALGTSSKFYIEYREKWEYLRWYRSITMTPD